MARKMLSLTLLGFLLAIGGFWALRAQDPAPQKPDTMKTEPQETKVKTTQVDLSGTYAGTFACEPAGLTGETTLTINGNEFTTSDGKSGRIVASRSRGYTAAALQMSGASSKVISLRAKKSGNKLTLSPIAGSTEQCTFTTSTNTGKMPKTTGTEVTTPTPTATPRQTPAPTVSPTPEASPSPEATPSPSGTPRPTPTASPSPGEPTPSPSPSPSPSPRPA